MKKIRTKTHDRRNRTLQGHDWRSCLALRAINMTPTEKRKIRGTNKCLIRDESRVRAPIGRVPNSEYASMTRQRDEDRRSRGKAKCAESDL